MEHNSQSIELMDALHTIGRNIAQQDAVRIRHAHALESIASSLSLVVINLAAIALTLAYIAFH